MIKKPIIDYEFPNINHNEIRGIKNIKKQSLNNYSYCKSLYDDYYKKNCDLNHIPDRRDSPNFISYIFNLIGWSFSGNRSGNYTKCLNDSVNKFNECMNQEDLSYGKVTLTPYTVNIPPTWINVHDFGVLANTEVNEVIASRVKGCDGGFNPNGTPNSESQNNDVINNNSKGIIQNLKFNDFSQNGFCKCPIGSSYTIEQNRCVCPPGQFPVYTAGSMKQTIKQSVCSNINCNDDVNNPGFNKDNINTYKFLNHLTNICESYS